MSGLSGTGMFWWWNAYCHYHPLAEIPLIEKNIPPGSKVATLPAFTQDIACKIHRP